MINWAHVRVMIMLSWREQLHYRAEMLISLITGPVYLLVNYIVWKSIFSANPAGTISGYTFEQMMSYYILTFSVSYLVWDNTCDWMESEISKGKFSNLLTKPMHVYRHYLYYKLGHRGLAFFVEFLPLLAISGLIFGILPLEWTHLIPFVASVIIASYVNFQIQFIMGTTTFWTTKSSGLTRLITWTSAIFAGKYFPLPLLPAWAQWLFLGLPFALTSFFPVQAALGGVTIAGIWFSPWMLIGYQCLYVIFLEFTMIRFYEHSVSKFGGVGV
ncbi:ABC-2 family transporter protein [Candidatus Woesearchaeota archaeon]|nr:ABC-2 family transporter protein [Candidatus Woesearchaeota archaeon]